MKEKRTQGGLKQPTSKCITLHRVQRRPLHAGKEAALGARRTDGLEVLRLRERRKAELFAHRIEKGLQRDGCVAVKLRSSNRLNGRD